MIILLIDDTVDDDTSNIVCLVCSLVQSEAEKSPGNDREKYVILLRIHVTSIFVQRDIAGRVTEIMFRSYYSEFYPDEHAEYVKLAQKVDNIHCYYKWKVCKVKFHSSFWRRSFLNYFTERLFMSVTDKIPTL